MIEFGQRGKGETRVLPYSSNRHALAGRGDTDCHVLCLNESALVSLSSMAQLVAAAADAPMKFLSAARQCLQLVNACVHVLCFCCKLQCEWAVGCEVLRMVRFIQIYTMEDRQHKLLVHLKYAESVYSTVH